MSIQTGVQGEQLIEAFQSTRVRTDAIFDCVLPEAYGVRPIPLRHPFVFYDGHLDAFNWNTVFRKILRASSFNPEFDTLFERGIDPSDAVAAGEKHISTWPERAAIQSYKAEVNRHLIALLESLDFRNPPHPSFQDGRVFHLLLEHEWMHQETLLYILHQLPESLKRKPPGYVFLGDTGAPDPITVEVPEGHVNLGARPGEFDFVWDNELPGYEQWVPAFRMDGYNVTNQQFLAFMASGGYENPAYWSEMTWQWKEQHAVSHPFFWQRQGDAWYYRGLFETVPLPMGWPAMVTHAEAEAYARYAGKRLMTEAEWHRAAYGDQASLTDPKAASGPVDFQRWNPGTVGSFQNPCGGYDLIGNGWEWTSTVFSPFEGFEASFEYPQYSADFFDGRHYVMKGGSWVTDRRLLRRTFRNWFYWHYPYMYATFRCLETQ